MLLLVAVAVAVVCCCERSNPKLWGAKPIGSVEVLVCYRTWWQGKNQQATTPKVRLKILAESCVRDRRLWNIFVSLRGQGLASRTRIKEDISVGGTPHRKCQRQIEIFLSGGTITRETTTKISHRPPSHRPP